MKPQAANILPIVSNVPDGLRNITTNPTKKQAMPMA
jgi:hypothetical protein